MENSWVSYKKTLNELFVTGLFSHNQWLEITENGIFLSGNVRSYQSCPYMKYELEEVLPKAVYSDSFWEHGG